MKKFVFVAVVSTVFLSACGPTKPNYTMPAVDKVDHDHYSKSGTSSFSGQAFLKTKGGDVKYAAGERSCIMPDIQYLAQFHEKFKTHTVVNHPSWLELTKCVTADSEGRFEFKNLPAGKWVATSNVSWIVPICNMYGCYDSYQGGDLSKKFETIDGELTKVILSR